MSDDHGEGFMDDSDDSGKLDRYEASFVDDQRGQSCDTQQHAAYLRSVRSPPMMRPHCRPLRPVTADIFSQAPDLDDTYDRDDSFVANSDSSDLGAEEDSLDLIEEVNGTCVMKKKGRVARRMMSSSSEEEPTDDQKKNDEDAERRKRLEECKRRQMEARKKLTVVRQPISPQLIAPYDEVASSPNAGSSSTSADEGRRIRGERLAVLVNTTEVQY